MAMFKPELIPNFPKGQVKDFSAIEAEPRAYYVSTKYDGVRAEIKLGEPLLGRSLKPIKSLQCQRMAEDLCLVVQHPGILEAEIYSPEMSFPEIIHFTRTEDVTSSKTKKKYRTLWAKTEGGTIGIYNSKKYLMEDLTPAMLKDGATIWEFPGRDVKWLTTWHDSLKFYVFNWVDPESNHTKERRDEILRGNVNGTYLPEMVYVEQTVYTSMDAIYQAYDQAIIDGEEGLVAIRKDALYKNGRHTLNSGIMFKLKDDELEYDGKILSVEEATKVIEGTAKTVNELGRSRTSKLKEDRVPSGLAKGFLCEMDNGSTLTVSLQGFDNEAKALMLKEPELYVGRWITFTGMQPVSDKLGAVPRSAFFKNFRDDK